MLLCAVMLGLGGAYAYAGLRGINVVLRNGGIYWISVTATDRRISPSMRLALATEAVGTPGPFQWQSVGAGFDVGELPVMLGDTEADRLLLVRIDPHRYRFIARTAPTGDTDLARWMTQLHPASSSTAATSRCTARRIRRS